MPITEVIPTFTTPVPSRSQSPDDFADAADLMVSEFNDVIASQDTLSGQINAESTTINGYSTAASASATAAANSATAAASDANFKGNWSSRSGAYLKGISVLNNRAYWRLLNDVSNIALSEPSPTNADWAFSSGTRWVTPYTASATLSANSMNTVIATSASADMAIPTLVTNDFIVLQNSPASTQTVRLMNSAYTIRGDAGSVSSGTNLILLAGEVIHLKAVSGSILEVV